MDISGLLLEAGQLMLIGMLVVFTFLGILVFVTKGLEMFAVEEPTPSTPTSSGTASSSQGAIPPQTVAAITAAVHQYRKK